MNIPLLLAPPAAGSRLLRTRRGLSALVIATFLIVNAIGLVPFRALAGDLTGWPRIAALAVLGYGLYLLAPVAVATWWRGRGSALAALGLTGSIREALLLAGGCSAVVAVGYALAADLAPAEGLALDLMRTAVLPGVAEELLFRAFLFGFLYRYAGWGFLPAALLSAVVFGVEHLYQGGDPLEALGIAALTALGGLWWSWLLVEWRWNIWVPIAFHVLLNAYWTLFDMGDTALGAGWTVVLRGACIVLSIGVTLALARRRGGRQVTGRRWWRGEPRS